jgi:hypothetical protein
MAKEKTLASGLASRQNFEGACPAPIDLNDIMRHALFGFALLIAIVGHSWGQSQPSPEQEAAAKHQELSKAANDKKIADFTKLLFDATAALAGIAVLQLFVFGWQGKQLKRTVEHLVISERAHVSGGANHGKASDGREFLVVTINNYGKTPAFIGNVAATICKKEELTTSGMRQAKL